MIQPLYAAYEVWLTFYYALPLPFQAFYNLYWAMFVVLCIVLLLFRSKH